MRIHAYKALRPRADIVAKVAAPPYDTVDTAESAQLAEGNPMSFLHINHSEIDLPAGTDLYADAVYTKAAENLKNFSSAALMLSSADGDDGNKTVGGKIIKMAGDAVNEFAKQAEKDSTASVNKNFVENGVKYGILVSGSMPVMMFAEPAENK